MDEPFICCYSDMLFTPRYHRRGWPQSPDDMALGVDTAWLERYEHRTDHPPDDAEKVTVANGRVTRDSPQDRRSATRTANTSAWRSSRRPGRRSCASITIAVASEFAGRPWREATRVREGVQDPAVSGHDRAGRAVRARRYAGRLHRSRHAAGFRLRAAALDDEASWRDER